MCSHDDWVAYTSSVGKRLNQAVNFSQYGLLKLCMYMKGDINQLQPISVTEFQSVQFLQCCNLTCWSHDLDLADKIVGDHVIFKLM